jgi:hypothetical protein
MADTLAPNIGVLAVCLFGLCAFSQHCIWCAAGRALLSVPPLRPPGSCAPQP